MQMGYFGVANIVVVVVVVVVAAVIIQSIANYWGCIACTVGIGKVVVGCCTSLCSYNN